MLACRSTSVILVLTLWLAGCGGDRASSDSAALAGIQERIMTHDDVERQLDIQYGRFIFAGDPTDRIAEEVHDDTE